MSKSVAPRDTEHPLYNCPPPGRRDVGHLPTSSLPHLDAFDMISCVLLGSCATLALFLAGTTFYYRRKVHTLRQEATYLVEEERRRAGRREEKANGRGDVRNGGRGDGKRAGRVEGRGKKDSGWSYPQQRRGREEGPVASRHLENSYLDMMLDTGAELYHEQYDEHGVQIDRRVLP